MTEVTRRFSIPEVYRRVKGCGTGVCSECTANTHTPDVDSFLLPVNFCQSTTLLSFLKLITFFCCHYFLLRNFWYNLFEIIFTHFFPQFFLPKFLKTMKKMIVLNLKRHILIRYFVIKMDHKIFTFFCFVLLTRNSNNYNKLLQASIVQFLNCFLIRVRQFILYCRYAPRQFIHPI